MNYSYLQTLTKGIKYLLVYAIAFVGMGLLAETGLKDVVITDFLSNTILGKLTFGSLLVMVLNYLKNRWGVRWLP